MPCGRPEQVHSDRRNTGMKGRRRKAFLIRRRGSDRPPGDSKPARWSCPVGFFLLVCCAAAQNTANWNTGAGNWSNANNWDCVTGNTSGHCVPSAGFGVTNIGGDITVDVDASVATINGTGGSLTLSGKTLSASDPLGIQLVNGTVNLSGGSIINGLLITSNLQVQ